MTPPAPILETVQGVKVVRDDLLPGGTKRRALEPLVASHSATEFVYASPAFGYAQIALAYACAAAGKRATVFVAKRRTLHPRSAAAQAAGARIEEIPHGYLTNVQANARAYAAAAGAEFLPFGMDMPAFIEALAAIARALPANPREVWCVAGSGVLARALQRAWPGAAVNAVRVGHAPDVGGATVWVAKERFEQPARVRPPFPSCDNYDAKAWRFVREWARPDALFWNVGA